MECGEISGLIMKYMDGDISEVEQKLLDKHKLSCEKCSKEFEILTEMAEFISGLPELSAPAGFESRVMERIRHQRSRTSMFNMLMGTAGLLVFAYYMTIFVIVPGFQESGILQIIFGYGSIVLKLIGECITKIIVYLPITIDNLLILRSILVRDYMNMMLFVAGGAMLLNLGLIRVINLQQE
ncbi:MAG: zf-HC2 domain-containing protein [Lutispora sp.]|nr:hypothetical protein [Lutispora sp.]MDD4833228.1 hypothetical protein [Lutispora sp.]